MLQLDPGDGRRLPSVRDASHRVSRARRGRRSTTPRSCPSRTRPASSSRRRAAAVQKAVEQAATVDPKTNVVTFDFSKITDPTAYPIPMVEYLAVPTKGLSAEKAKALSNFVKYVLSDAGQKIVADTGYVPVSKELRTSGLKVAAALAATSNQQAVTTTTATGGARPPPRSSARPLTPRRPRARPSTRVVPSAPAARDCRSPEAGRPRRSSVAVAVLLVAAVFGRRHTRARPRMTPPSPASTAERGDRPAPEIAAAALERAVDTAWHLLEDAAEVASRSTGGPVRIDVNPRGWAEGAPTHAQAIGRVLLNASVEAERLIAIGQSARTAPATAPTMPALAPMRLEPITLPPAVAEPEAIPPPPPPPPPTTEPAPELFRLPARPARARRRGRVAAAGPRRTTRRGAARHHAGGHLPQAGRGRDRAHVDRRRGRADAALRRVPAVGHRPLRGARAEGPRLRLPGAHALGGELQRGPDEAHRRAAAEAPARRRDRPDR